MVGKRERERQSVREKGWMAKGSEEGFRKCSHPTYLIAVGSEMEKM